MQNLSHFLPGAIEHRTEHWSHFVQECFRPDFMNSRYCVFRCIPFTITFAKCVLKSFSSSSSSSGNVPKRVLDALESLQKWLDYPNVDQLSEGFYLFQIMKSIQIMFSEIVWSELFLKTLLTYQEDGHKPQENVTQDRISVIGVYYDNQSDSICLHLKQMANFYGPSSGLIYICCLFDLYLFCHTTIEVEVENLTMTTFQ
jgi:hypothetical protein